MIKRHFAYGKPHGVRYVLSPVEVRPRYLAESAPSMWSRGVKIQIENHLANLPVIRSVNKFRFTRVGGLRYGSAREARRDARRDVLTCIKATERSLYMRRKRIPVEYFEASERIFLSLDRAEARVRNIRPCNLLNRR